MEDQGIMALPMGGMQAPTASPFDPAASAAFEQIRQQVSPREFSSELLTAAEQADPVAVRQLRQILVGLRLPQEVIDAMQQMTEIVLRSPQNYPEIRRQMLADGVPEDLLPETFDAMFFGALQVALNQIEAEATAQPVQSFAMGGVANLRPIAQAMQSMGRGQDTMLAHITPQEARMLQAMGGIGTINPTTGLREFGFFSSIGKAFKSVTKAISGVFKSIGNAVKSFARSSIGRIVTSVALGFFLGPAAASLIGVTSAAGVAAVSGFVGGFGSSVLAGQSLSNSLKSGVIGGITAGATAGITQGANAFQANSYAGPTTVAGQYDSAVNSGKSLLGLSGAPTDVTGNLSYTGEGGVVPGINPPATPTTAELARSNITQTAMDAFDASNVAPGTPAPVSAPPPTVSAPAPIAPSGEITRTAMDAFDLSNVAPTPSTPAAPVTTVASTDQGIGALSRPATATGYNAVDAQDLFTGRQSPMGGPVRTFGAPASVTPGAPGTSAMDYFRQGEYLQGAKEVFMPRTYTATELIQSPQYRLLTTPIAQGGGGLSGEAALKAVTAELNPGMFRSYAPAVAAGTGIMALSGGFTPQQEPPPDEASKLYGSQSGAELLKEKPDVYGTSPGGAQISYYTPPYMGYNLPTMQYTRPMIYFNAPQYRYGFANGGIASLAKGGPTNFPRKTGPINGPGTGTSDSIPAMLSDGEFVFTAKAVRAMGKGSRRLGAKRMYALMKALEGKKNG